MNTRHGVAALVLVVLGAAGARRSAEQNDSLRPRALRILRTAMESEQRWIKVHAAEALLSLGCARICWQTLRQGRMTA